MYYIVFVYVIFFNCNDKEVNEFLFDFVKVIGGRYYYFFEKGKDFD